MIDVHPDHLAEIKRILAMHAPGCKVCVFGSRVNGNAQPSSDLDLVLMGQKKFDWRFIERLKDAFAASDLPFMVDVIDWHDMTEELKNLVKRNCDTIQTCPTED